MPAKGSKAAATAAGKAKAKSAAAPACGAVEIELRPGERDNLNLTYVDALTEACQVISDHHIFQGITEAMPLSVSGNALDSGNQAPFDVNQYKHALRTASQSYTAGINLFWIDPLWSATPGVPLRMGAIEHMSRTVFMQPSPVAVHIGVEQPSFNPLQHKGALKRVSPEELTAAVFLAIARDIKNQEPDALLRQWRRQCLSTTATFKLLADSNARYWYALQQRELAGTTHRVVSRSTFQRLHEISRLMRRLRETRPASEVTAAAIAAAYAQNLQMTAGSAATVTLNFVDCCATITNTLLDVPDISCCLQDLDERAAVSEDPNPFDSHSRLQAVVDKCRANNQQQLIWVVQGIWYHWRRGTVKTLSIVDLKGNAATGNRGFADLLLFKYQLKATFLARAAQDFPELDSWLKGPLACAANTHRSWLLSEDSADKAWRAGLPAWQSKWLALFECVVFGRAYDAVLKLALKSGKGASETLASPGIVEYLDDVKSRRATELGEVQPGDAPAGSAAPSAACSDETTAEGDIVFTLCVAGREPTVVKASQVQDGPRREMLDSIIGSTRQQMAAHIHLVSQELDQDPPHPLGLKGVLMDNTPLGSARGAPEPSNPARSKYIGIFYDPKLAGEANHRPMIRVPPLRTDKFQELVTAARSRFGAEVPDGELPPGDLYFLCDGGKPGNQTELMRPFHGMTKSVRTFTLWRDEESLVMRLARQRGTVGTYRQQEHLYVVSATLPAVRPVKFQNYNGSSAGTMMGPIILPRLDACWHLSWADKKLLYTPLHLIAVGGKLDEEEDMLPGEKPPKREDSKPEPVFYHALPETFYEELLRAFPLSVVLDLTPGDGSLAMACYRKGGITYIGTTFSEFHRKALLNHIEAKIWQAMATDTDVLYEPRLAASLREENDTDSGPTKPKPNKPKPAGKPKPRAKQSNKRKADALSGDERGAEEDLLEGEVDEGGEDEEAGSETKE
jgi:hypothetical protein